MKIKLTLFISLLLVQFHTVAQSEVTIDDILNQEHRTVEQLVFEGTKTAEVVQSEFTEASLQSTLSGLEGVTVIKVYYVYTAFRKSESFDQHVLNRKRLEELRKQLPHLFQDPYIEWEVVEQTGCKSPEEGEDFFHGFILVHRPVMTEEERLKEIEQLEAFFKNPSAGFYEEPLDPVETLLSADTAVEKKPIADEKARYKEGDFALYKYLQGNLSGPGEINTTRTDTWVDVSFTIDEFGRVMQIDFEGDHKPFVEDKLAEVLRLMPDWIPASSGGSPVESQVNLSVRVSYSRSVSGMYTRDGVKPVFLGDETRSGLLDKKELSARDQERAQAIISGPVFKGLNLLDSTHTYSVVMDVTGSMTGNIASLMFWLENNPDTLRISRYFFFNDGDKKSTREKKIGETGGIYTSDFVQHVYKNVSEAMRAGSGGEISESDIEAVLYAIEHDSESDEVLLIGDNFSDVRDLKLLDDVDKPVNILICAAPNSIRVDYLQIARETGGLIFWNGSVIDVSSLQKDDQITIGKKRYRFNGKTFKMLKDKVT